MTVTPKISVVEDNLVVHGKTILTGVPDNVILTPGSGVGLVQGAFIGVTSPECKSHHVFPIGVLDGLRFTCLFRFKLWWMTQRMGRCGKDVPLETQFMLVESKYGSPLSRENDLSEEEQTVYTVFLPLIEGQFRAVLQGNERDEIEVCLESGDASVKTNQGLYAVYIHAGSDPFEVITDAVRAVEKHLQTFQHREKKKLPAFVDWFGWCTWDAFYTDVTAEGVDEGLKSLSQGGTPPRFLIIDDGWQQIDSEVEDPKATVQEGAQFASRLTGIKENQKFRKHRKGTEITKDPPGLRHVVEEAKDHHNVKYVYVWHALTGYWGGVNPSASGMEHYDSALAYPVQSPGVIGNQPDVVMDSLSVYGLGLVHPKKVFNFYNELHSYLATAGVDGVKVDVQNIIETLGAGHGGRVSITRQYLQALEASINHNFPDNGCIACMCHNTDGLYSAKQTAVVRASDDFYPRDPASHTIHISSVAYNTMFLGEFMFPDWDMFHSLHPSAEYHGAARAVGGCAIYVSDKPGIHNFDLLKKLVLPDGSVLRAQLPGRPTRDCIFVDPARDGKSLLKIWNLNKYTGMVGAFNCQGAGDAEITEKPSVEEASKVAAPKKKPERSNSLKKKGSFKKDETSDELARSSSAKEDVDAILIQCGRLSRSSSGKASNDNNAASRQYSGSKRQAADEVEEKPRARPSHRRSSSRDLTARSVSLDGSSKRVTGRRISPSPVRRPEPSMGRRSENTTERSRVRNAASAGVSKRPAKRGSNSGELGNCSVPITTSRSRSPAPRIDGVVGFPQSLSRSSSRKAEQSPFRLDPEEPAKNVEESGKIFSSSTATQIQSEPEPVKKEKRVALKEINGNSNSIRDQLLSCRAASTLKATQQAKSFDEGPATAKSSSHKRNGETEVLDVFVDDQTNGAVNVDEVLAQISRSRSARRSRDQFLLESQALFDSSGEAELKGFSLPASVSKAQSILEAVADLNSSVNSNSSMKSLVSNASFEQGKSARFLASFEEAEKSEIMREFHRNVSARNSNAEWTEQGQEESAGSNSQTLTRLSGAKKHRYFSSEDDDLTSFEASAKAASKTEEKDDDLKSSSSLRQSSARYFNISPEDVLLNPHLGIKRGEESSSRSNLVPVITFGKKEFNYSKRANNLQNGRTFSELSKQNYSTDIDFKASSLTASDLGATSMLPLNLDTSLKNQLHSM